MASDEYNEIQRRRKEERQRAIEERLEREALQADEDMISQLRRMNDRAVADEQRNTEAALRRVMKAHKAGKGDPAKSLKALHKAQDRAKKARKANNKGCMALIITVGLPASVAVTALVHYL